MQALASWAAEEIARGRPVEQVALEAVQRRNELKQRFREGMDPTLLRLLELRNVRKYGDPIGPKPAALLQLGRGDRGVQPTCAARV